MRNKTLEPEKLYRPVFPRWPEIQIIPEWLTTRQLGMLTGVGSDTVKHQIYRGVYRTATKMQSTRGLVWKISVYDEAIPGEIRTVYERQLKRGQTELDGAAVDRLSASIIEKLDRIIELLETITQGAR